MKNTSSDKQVIAITVTYGERWSLLEQVISAAKNEGVAKVVVVDNGSKQDIKQHAEATFGDFVDVVTMGRNTGSAGGFKAGFERALEHPFQYILLLDDDNKMEDGCLKHLQDSFDAESGSIEGQIDTLAVLAFRPEHQADVAMGLPASRINARMGSYFGFHLLDIPFKIWRRLPIGKSKLAKAAIPEKVLMNVAPWSGLYFHRSLITLLGLPNENLVLYADDTEYTWRITASGGRIVLCTSACIKDIDESWNLKSHYRNNFDALLLGASEFRVHYGVRNRAYFDKNNLKNGLWWQVNRACFLAILLIRALLLGRFARYGFIFRALQDGEMSRLGVSEKFPLN